MFISLALDMRPPKRRYGGVKGTEESCQLGFCTRRETTTCGGLLTRWLDYTFFVVSARIHVRIGQRELSPNGFTSKSQRVPAG